MKASRSRVIGCLLSLGAAAALSACGAAKHPSDATAENNGYYVHLGGISYQLQVSRQLNQYATEDDQYLVGVPAGTQRPGGQQVWYGVFLRAINDGKHNADTTTSFDIIDTQGHKYYPVPLNPQVNPYAWRMLALQPLQTEPLPDTTAFYGPTQGGLVLFKLPTAVYSNRPLTLEIHGSGSKAATISLDL